MQEGRGQESVIEGKKAGRAEIQVKNHKLFLCVQNKILFYTPGA